MKHQGPPDRRHRIEVFCASYGISVPVDIVSLVGEQQQSVRDTVMRLAPDGVEPQTTWVSDGYLDVLQARIDWTALVDLSP